MLTILSFYDINLTKIQSLPNIGHEWEWWAYQSCAKQWLVSISAGMM
ncbi:Uncharacterised protein [Segatella copri]|nr:Uncharacterised protein [Segatella copri]